VTLAEAPAIALPNELLAAGWTQLQPRLAAAGIDANARPFAASCASDIPFQAGLSGSSALLVAALRAWSRWYGLPLAPSQIAELAWRAENETLGIRAGALDRLVQAQGYVLGARPSSADFAIYGQLTQLGIIEPTSAAIMAKVSRRVRGWLDRVEDLSGLAPAEGDWISREAARASMKPLLAEIGRVYAPFLLANAKAVMAGAQSFDTEIDGRAWTQPTFPYQAKCLKWIRDEFSALGPADQSEVRGLFAGTGCDALIAGL